MNIFFCKTHLKLGVSSGLNTETIVLTQIAYGVFISIVEPETEVFNTGGWAMECSPNDMSGFDRLLASDPTRLHPFMVF